MHVLKSELKAKKTSLLLSPASSFHSLIHTSIYQNHYDRMHLFLTLSVKNKINKSIKRNNSMQHYLYTISFRALIKSAYIVCS